MSHAHDIKLLDTRQSGSTLRAYKIHSSRCHHLPLAPAFPWVPVLVSSHLTDQLGLTELPGGTLTLTGTRVEHSCTLIGKFWYTLTTTLNMVIKYQLLQLFF